MTADTPERIWIQAHDRYGDKLPYITWSMSFEQFQATDVEYIRADVHDELLAAALRVLEQHTDNTESLAALAELVARYDGPERGEVHLTASKPGEPTTFSLDIEETT